MHVKLVYNNRFPRLIFSGAEERGAEEGDQFEEGGKAAEAGGGAERKSCCDEEAVCGEESRSCAEEAGFPAPALKT